MNRFSSGAQHHPGGEVVTEALLEQPQTSEILGAHRGAGLHLDPGTPGRIFAREGDDVVIVAGADARRGHNHGLVIERLRTDDGSEHAAAGYFRTMGGYLTTHP